MTTFTGSDDLRGTEFRGVRLGAARFVESDLSDVVIRGSEVAGMEIDAPWLVHGDPLMVNGVDVVAFVEAELDRRFPGRSQRRADAADGLRSAWAAVERQWAATLTRVETMPPGTVDISVAGEWSFAQTLRHLVHATDLWLGRSVLELERPPHPLGLSYSMEAVADSGDASAAPSYDEVLEVRAGRVAMVRDLLATVTDEELATIRRNPHNPDRPETTRSCLHVILEEEWEHHRIAVRDLDLIESGDGVAATHGPPDSA
jgi:uncharacterized damage-inducible protein DinB